MKHLRNSLSSLFAAVLLALPTVSTAQTDDDDFGYMDIYAGPRIGVAASNLTQLDGDFLFGPSIGGFFEVRLTPRIALSFDMNYTHEGTSNARCSFSAANADAKSDISIHWLNSDYRIRYYLTRQLNLAAGLHLGRMLRAFGETDGRSIKIHSHCRRGTLAIPLAAEYSLGPWAVEASCYLPFRSLARTQDLKDIMGRARPQLVTLTLAYKIQVF